MFSIDRKNKKVRLELRKGLYSEEAIEKAMGALPEGIQGRKTEKKESIEIELKTANETDLEELAGWFSSTAIAMAKEMP